MIHRSHQPRPVRGGGQQHPPPAGQQQQPCADRPVGARQPQVGARPCRGEPVHPVAAHGVLHLPLWRFGSAGHMVLPMSSRAKIRLYVEHPLGAGQTVPLSRDQAHYLFGVMRQGVGAPVALFNGSQGEWTAEVVEAGKRAGVLECREQAAPQVSPPDLWLLFAPIKKARTDFIVEKATEMGAARDPAGADRFHQCRACAAGPAAGPRHRGGGTMRRHLRAPGRGFAAARPGAGRLARRPAPDLLRRKPCRSAGGARCCAGRGDKWAILIGPVGGFSEAERARFAPFPAAPRSALAPASCAPIPPRWRR